VGDTGPPLVSDLTKHADTNMQALPLCAPSSDVNMRPKSETTYSSQNQESDFSTRQWGQNVYIGDHIDILIPLEPKFEIFHPEVL